MKNNIKLYVRRVFIMENCDANILVVEDDKQLAKFLDFKV